MLSIFSIGVLFITSYIPLYIILFVQYLDFSASLFKQPLLLILLIIILVSLIILKLFLHIIRKQKNLIKTVEIRNVRTMKESNLTYLLSNIIPLIAFDFTNRQQIASFLIIFLVLLMMYVKYCLIAYNPTTELLRYTNYLAEIYKDDKKIADVIILSKCKFYHQNTFYTVKGIQLDNDFWIVTKNVTE